MSSPVERLFELSGGPSGMKRAFKLRTIWAAAKWLRMQRIPPYRIIPACQLVGFAVTPHELDPVLYPFPTDGIPAAPVNHEAKHDS
jgi:hypothetical protein